MSVILSSSSSSSLLCILLLLLASSSLTVAVGIERETEDNVPALIQRELLSSPPSNCLHNPVGGTSTFDNPSNVAMGMVYIDGTSTNEKYRADFGNTSDVDADGNWALKWCQNVFGSSSYPMFPDTADKLTAMKSLCKEKGSDEFCYFGMYRPVTDIGDTTHSETVCDTLQNHDGSFSFDPANLGNAITATPKGLGGTWTNSYQPTCSWVDSSHVHHEYMTVTNDFTKHQCLEWRPVADKYHMQNCRLTRHIICYRVDSTCDTPPNSPFPLAGYD